jgi:hypothetical protein
MHGGFAEEGEDGELPQAVSIFPVFAVGVSFFVFFAGWTFSSHGLVHLNYIHLKTGLIVNTRLFVIPWEQ